MTSVPGPSAAHAERSRYRPRVADPVLAGRLSHSGAVVVEGARACGKTWTAREASASEVLLDVDDQARRLARLDPGELLAGATPRLIDEWQLVPQLWNHVRRAVDDRRAASRRRADGQFILTGSFVPADDVSRHTGAGRFSRLRLRPMTLFETGLSTGAVSLAATLRGDRVRASEARFPTRELARAVCIGGWPTHLDAHLEGSLRANRDYLGEVARVDVARANGTRHDPVRVLRLLQSLARNVATCASLNTVAADVGGRDAPLTTKTARNYMTALERLMIVEDQPPWAPHLRSRSRLRLAPKRHLVDPSLATAALRATPDHLMRDIEWLGLLFESLVVRDLRVYAQAQDATVHHYRDNTGLEVDAIVDAGLHRWAAFEVKLGDHRIDAAAASLLKFADRVDTDRWGEPAALAVIVHSGYAYTRTDGVAVIPIGALGP